jgi:hypothetical protein
MNANLTSIEALALSKALAEKDAKEARTNINPGKHAVDLTVRIVGTFNVAEDTDKAPTCSIPLRAVLAELLHTTGAVREAAERALCKVTTDAINGIAPDPERQAVVDAWEAAHLQPVIDKLPRTPVKGKVTTKLTVEVVRQPELAAA